MTRRKLLLAGPVGLGLLLTPVLGTPAADAATAATEADAPLEACAPATSSTAAAFFDSALPGRLAREHVPGAVVSVVSRGTTVLAKGYGTADVATGTPFDPDRSLVRIASITKLFTWTAVMQQVEAGRLDLDADVNRYLTAFTIPATYPRPVTLASLMDHTSGFEGQVIGTAARTAADVEPLETYLAGHVPARIRPPGEASAYSNYGAALAGYIVSRVSGEPYDRYVEDHLLRPLAMTRTTASEPIPTSLAGHLASSYDSDVSPPRRVPFTFDPLTPDGSISTTATDMAHFMIAHLDQGRYAQNQILSPATTALMHTRSFAADPRLGGYAHGFMDRVVNGHRVLMHDGSWEGFESVLILVPDCDLGLFVSANATGGIAALTDVLRDFEDRFLPPITPSNSGPSTSSSAPLGTATPPRAGFYEPARHNESTVEKLNTLLSPLRLTVLPDGSLQFKGMTWTTRGDGLYRTADDRDHLVFRVGSDGRFYAANDGPTYELMAVSDTLPVNLAVLGFLAATGISALALPVVGAVRRGRRARRRPAWGGRLWRAARMLAGAATLVGLVFLILLAATLLGDTGDFLYAVPTAFRVVLGLPLLALTLGAAALALTVAGWRRSSAGVMVRVHQVTLLAGAVALGWFVVNWNLLGWRFH